MPENPSKLNDADVAAHLRELPEWSVGDSKLTRAFKFPDFVSAIDFVNRIAGVAEAQGHHPDLFVTWGEVDVSLTSHSAGGLTANDFELAGMIDNLAA
jgi:4a-hydroxytetrahydrobiopterin dehydratase